MSSFNKPIPEIQVGVTGFITTTDSSDTFAVTHPFYSAGGFKYSDDIVERDAILPSRRIPEITVVYVDSVDTWFQLQGGITNTDWVSLGSEPFNETLTGSEIKALYEAELDTNAFTDAEKSKLNGIEAGAEVNVQADWNETDNTSGSFIKNKPTLTEYVSLSASTDSPVSKFSRVFKGPVAVDTVSLSFNADISSITFEAREGNGSVIGLADLADLSTWIGSNIATNDIWQIRAIIVFNASYVGDGECTFKIYL